MRKVRLKYSPERIISLIIILLLCVGAVIFGEIKAEKELPQHLQPYFQERYTNESLDSKNRVDESFKTHLPLVIIDTYGENPKADSVWSEEKGYRVPVEYDPYVNGQIKVIHNEDELNYIDSHPAVESDIKIRLRGNSSLEFDKKQYFIKLVDEDGDKNEQNILDMGKEWEWILNISFIDKSLLRNYLCLSIAGEIMPYTPDMKFCEVLIKRDDGYEYQGVYLMMESIKRDENRLNLPKYDPKEPNSSYFLRRDRYDETGIMLNNYATREGLLPSFLEVKYPNSQKINDETIEVIEEEIDSFEKALFSEEEEDFFEYKKYIDSKSFADYFIINEFFANYDAGYNSTYIYKEQQGKISMGPVWDFDHAMDNFDHTQLRLDTTAMHDAPWFRQLLKDEAFVEEVINRYYELRKDVLAERYIIGFIDQTIDYLGEAIERDWDRWGYFYRDDYLYDLEDEEGNPINRNTRTHEEELEKIKNILIAHGNWLDDNIDSIYQFVEFNEYEPPQTFFHKLAKIVLGKEEILAIGSLGALLFVGVFIISIILVQREE